MTLITCPACSSDQLEVRVSGWAPLVQDPADDTQLRSGEVRGTWDDASAVRCPDCGTSAALSAFRAWRDSRA